MFPLGGGIPLRSLQQNGVQHVERPEGDRDHEAVEDIYGEVRDACTRETMNAAELVTVYALKYTCVEIIKPSHFRMFCRGQCVDLRTK